MNSRVTGRPQILTLEIKRFRHPLYSLVSCIEITTREYPKSVHFAFEKGPIYLRTSSYSGSTRPSPFMFSSGPLKLRGLPRIDPDVSPHGSNHEAAVDKNYSAGRSNSQRMGLAARVIAQQNNRSSVALQHTLAQTSFSNHQEGENN